MLTPIIVWAVLAPSVLCGLVLGLALRPWSKPRADEDLVARGSWAAGPAVALGYAVGQIGLIGWQPLSGDITQWLIYLAAAGALAGTLEGRFALPAGLSWALRLALSTAAAWLLLRPLLAQNLGWAWVCLLAAAFVLVWTVIDVLARQERGPALALLVSVLAGGVSATVVFSGNASTGMLSGALISTLGALFVVTLRFPAVARLRSAAPVLALVVVGQLAVGRFYTDGMPLLSFVLLLCAPLALLAVHLLVRRVGASLRSLPVDDRAQLLAAPSRGRQLVVLAARLVALAIPVALAAGLAASAYFAPSASSGSESSAASGQARPDTTKPGAAKSAATKPENKGPWDGEYGYDF